MVGITGQKPPVPRQGGGDKTIQQIQQLYADMQNDLAQLSSEDLSQEQRKVLEDNIGNLDPANKDRNESLLNILSNYKDIIEQKQAGVEFQAETQKFAAEIEHELSPAIGTIEYNEREFDRLQAQVAQANLQDARDLHDKVMAGQADDIEITEEQKNEMVARGKETMQAIMDNPLEYFGVKGFEELSDFNVELLMAAQDAYRKQNQEQEIDQSAIQEPTPGFAERHKPSGGIRQVDGQEVSDHPLKDVPHIAAATNMIEEVMNRIDRMQPDRNGKYNLSADQLVDNVLNNSKVQDNIRQMAANGPEKEQEAHQKTAKGFAGMLQYIKKQCGIAAEKVKGFCKKIADYLVEKLGIKSKQVVSDRKRDNLSKSGQGRFSDKVQEARRSDMGRAGLEASRL